MFTDAVDVRRTPLLTPSFSALLIAQTCFGYAFSTFFLLPKFIVTELAAGPREVGMVTSVFGVSAVLCLPAMGAIVDRFGRRVWLTAGAIVMAAACFAFTQVDEVGPLLYALRAVQGVAFAMAFVGGAALAVDEAPPERLGQAIGIFGLTFLAMNAVAPALAEEIAGRASWGAAFTAAGVVALISSALSRRVRDRHARPAEGDGIPTLWEVMARPSQLRVALVIALVGAAMCSVFVFSQPFAIELGMSKVRSFFVAYAATAVTVRVGLGHFIDRFGRRRASVASLALYVGVVLATTQLRSSGLAPLGVGLGIAHGTFYPAFNAVALDGRGAHERGKVMALFQAAFNVGFSLAAVLFGELAAREGYPSVFLAGAVCALVALVALVASPDGRSAGAREP